MVRFSFGKLDNGMWGVKASGDLGQATRFAGQTVQVTKRSGEVKTVALGAMVSQWNGGRAALYATASTRPASNYGSRPDYRNHNHYGRRVPEINAALRDSRDEYDDSDSERARDEQDYAAGIEDAKRERFNRQMFGESYAAAEEYARDMRGLNGDY